MWKLNSVNKFIREREREFSAGEREIYVGAFGHVDFIS